MAWQLVVAGGFDLPRMALAPVRRQLVITVLRVHIARGVDLAAVTAILAETLAQARALWGTPGRGPQLLALAAWQQWQLHDRAVGQRGIGRGRAAGAGDRLRTCAVGYPRPGRSAGRAAGFTGAGRASRERRSCVPTTQE